jgi:uncharacterized damage-inducible protein DinB
MWLPYVLDRGLNEEKSVFKHILAASTVWVARLGGTSVTAMPDVAISEGNLLDLHRRWLAALDELEFDQVIAYRNTRGDAYERKVSDIAQHVINHGTYHRGQIRGLFGIRNQEFPDTDFLGFSFERDNL